MFINITFHVPKFMEICELRIEFTKNPRKERKRRGRRKNKKIVY
jgi:hypothetical protein